MEHLLTLLIYRIHLEAKEEAGSLGSDQAQLSALQGASSFGFASTNDFGECRALQDLGDFQRLVYRRWQHARTFTLDSHVRQLQRLCSGR
jgi:hypothetical protein